MENIKCIVFDFDDTIVLSEEMKQRVFYEISTKYKEKGIEYYNNNISKKPTREQYCKGLSQYIIEHTLVDNESSIYLYTLLLEEFSNKVSSNLKNSKELPSARKFIEYIFNKGYTLYISSKSNEKDIIETLKYKDLLKYFKGIYGLPNPKIEHFIDQELIYKYFVLIEDFFSSFISSLYKFFLIIFFCSLTNQSLFLIFSKSFNSFLILYIILYKYII